MAIVRFALVIVIILSSIGCEGKPGLKITSEPPGATVSLDGKEIGTTPYTGQIAPGDHELVLSKEGYHTVTKELSVKSGTETIDVQLEELRYAKIVSQPPGATVSLDGKEIGTTPYTGEISPGQYRLTLSKTGYQSVNRQLSIESGSESIDAQLESISLSNMIQIPAGPFLMGSSDEEIKKVVRDLGGGELGPDVQWFAAERPQHEARVEEFYIDKYEVTNAEYKEFVDATGRAMPRHWEGGTYPEGKADHPVVYVSWEDANAYCRWVGKRLPTEIEWEKAARGTDARIWPWGNTFDITKCNVESWEGSGSRPVGSYPGGVSPYGVYDMAGNVWEWTDSWYDPYPGSKYSTTEFGEKLRVLRGGSWYHYDSLGPIGARCASRDRAVPLSISYVAGFRCAIGADELPNSQ